MAIATTRQEQSEVELLEAWCEGSEAAGDALLRRVFPSLYRFFINKVGDETEDLVQQTLIACSRHRKAIHDSGAFRPWLFRIARSRLYDHLRSLCRRNDRLDADFDRVSVVDAGTTHTSRVARGRAAQEVREALRSLPVHLQLVLELHYWEEQSTGEIAESLEIPQGTVKSRLRIAREALEAALATTGAEVLERLGKARPDVDGLP